MLFDRPLTDKYFLILGATVVGCGMTRRVAAMGSPGTSRLREADHGALITSAVSLAGAGLDGRGGSN